MQGSEGSTEHLSHGKQPLIFRGPDYDPQLFYSPGSEPEVHVDHFYTSRVPPVTQPSAPYFSDIKDVPAHDLYQKFLSRIEGRQEALQYTRDRLVGSRYRLRTKREELRITREKAAIQTGVSHDLVRIYLLENDIKLPDKIQTAMLNAEQLRDTLGTEEVEYEEMEEAYNKDEWTYSQEEEDFVENLVDASTDGRQYDRGTAGEVAEEYIHMPASFSGHMSASAGIAGAGSHFEAPELSSSDFQPSFLRQPLLEQAEELSMIQYPNRTMVWPDYASDQGAWELKTPLEQYVEDTSHPGRHKWQDVSERINTWLWKVLESSKFEQQRLRSLSPENDMNEADWWELVRETWSGEDHEDLLISTGDTTVSHGISFQFSSIDENRPYFEMNPEEDSIYDLNDLPLLPNELQVDALELVDIPPAIESSDLIDRAIKRVTFMERTQSARSISTQQTIATRGSSRYDDSAFIDDDDNSWTSSEDLDTIRKGEFGDGSGKRPWFEEHKMQIGPPEDTEVIETSPRVQNPSISFGIGTEPNHDPHQSKAESPWQSSAKSNDTKISLAENPVTTVSIQSHPGLDTPQATKPYLSSSEPFIRIDSPEQKPWRLPLLRLTPSEESSQPRSDHRLEYLPFVSFEDSPLWLPGPSTLDLPSVWRVYIAP